MQDIMKILKNHTPQQKDGFAQITLPVVLLVSGGLLTLKITQNEEFYTISCEEDMFSECNGSQEFYYDIFKKHDKNYHYEIQIKNNIIFKQYKNDFNLVVAINEFIRFFILLDDFIINNNVIGNETAFL